MKDKTRLEPGVQFITAEAFVSHALAAYTAAVRASAPPRDHDAREGTYSSPEDFAHELLANVARRVVEQANNAGVVVSIEVGCAGISTFHSFGSGGLPKLRGCGTA